MGFYINSVQLKHAMWIIFLRVTMMEWEYPLTQQAMVPPHQSLETTMSAHFHCGAARHNA